jgi:predicted phosphodiesterase
MDNTVLHELVAALKSVALELGRSPSRAEFERAVHGGHRKLRAVGGFAVVQQAAGLNPYVTRNHPKITNQIFERDIHAHLAEHKPKELMPKTPWPKIAVLGDMHEPFSHAKLKADFIQFCRDQQPDWIVQVGDAVDFYSHSKFPRSHNIFTPKQEEQLARENLDKFWAELALAAPNAKRVMLVGNHGIRPIKRVLEAVPTIEHWAEKYLADYLSFKDVHTVMDTREEYLITDIAFIHGYKSVLGAHRDHLLSNVVCGHTHTGGASFRSFRGRTFWELNAGLAADIEAPGLTYTATRTTGWTLGWAWIDQYGPRFIPYC